jgi:hypothetical protein
MSWYTKLRLFMRGWLCKRRRCDAGTQRHRAPPQLVDHPGADHRRLMGGERRQAIKESPLADTFHATVETILVLMLIVFAVALLARWARLPYTIALVVTGLLGFQPGFRDLQLTPT